MFFLVGDYLIYVHLFVLTFVNCVFSDESRSPNTSSSHPFYTADNQHLSFKSFHTNSGHKAGPVLSSFLKKKQNRQHIDDRHNQHYPMNDLSNPNSNPNPNLHKNLVQHNSYNPYRNSSEQSASPRNSGNLNFEPQYGSQTLSSFGKVNHSLGDHPEHRHSGIGQPLPPHLGTSYDDSIANLSQDDDNTTTTSGSFTIQDDFHDEMLSSDAKDMFYKPDTFV